LTGPGCAGRHLEQGTAGRCTECRLTARLVTPACLAPSDGRHNRASQLPDSGNVTLNSGNLSYIGNGNVSGGTVSGGELAGALVLNPGQDNVTITRSGTAYTPYLRFASRPDLAHDRTTVSFWTDANSYIQFQANRPL